MRVQPDWIVYLTFAVKRSSLASVNLEQLQRRIKGWKGWLVEQHHGQRYARELSCCKECDCSLIDLGMNEQLVFDGVMFFELGGMTLSPRPTEYDVRNVVVEDV